MSDVNTYIEQWKQNLGKTDSYNMDNIEELESHLRDSMEHLTAQGLSEEEAFLIAHNRLGDTSMLTKEFGKENIFLVCGQRVLWMLLGIVIMQVGQQFNTLVLYLASTLAVLLRLPHGFMNILSIGIRVGLTCLLITGIIVGPMLYVKSRAFRSILDRARKWSIIFGIVAMGIGIISMIMPQIYVFVLVRLKGAEDIGRYMMFDQVFRYGYALFLVLIPIVGIIVLDLIMRKKQARVCVEG